MLLVSSRRGGGGCRTTTSLVEERGTVSLMIVVSRVTLSGCCGSELEQAERVTSAIEANKRKNSVVRLMGCVSFAISVYALNQ
jgi:hypothetical protein